jgi:acetyl-CoA carboxylase biotin carboxylase subunit/3-methylcrotonyl-CoA carboxylase alpha subunit
VDAGYAQGNDVTPHYDPLIAKIVAHAPTRAEAIARLDAALAGTEVRLVGTKGHRVTNLNFLRRILECEEFRIGDYDTALISRIRPAGR